MSIRATLLLFTLAALPKLLLLSWATPWSSEWIAGEIMQGILGIIVVLALIALWLPPRRVPPKPLGTNDLAALTLYIRTGRQLGIGRTEPAHEPNLQASDVYKVLLSELSGRVDNELCEHLRHHLDATHDYARVEVTLRGKTPVIRLWDLIPY